MGTLKDALRLLAEVEVGLRGLMEEAVKEHRYADVAEIAQITVGLARLMEGQRVQPQATVVTRSSDRPRADLAGKVSTRPTRNQARPAYPQFERDGDKLVKIGWSKKQRTAYEHRAPRDAVFAVARHLLTSVSEGAVFSAEELLPIPDIVHGGDLPTYQVYLALAWFRHIGAIEKKGRDGYVLRRAVLTDGSLDRIWAEVKRRPN